MPVYHMAEPHEYEFLIDAYTPETIPMARLAKYLTDLATLLGNHASVHLIGIERGSVRPKIRIDAPDVPKVQERLHAVRANDAPMEAMRAYRAIDARLARDNATGSLTVAGSKVIEFPGRDRFRDVPPLSEAGTLDGIVVTVGGKDNPPTVHLQSEAQAYVCHASRILTKRIAQHLYGDPIRVNGMGRWERDSSERWALTRFTIHDFVVLRDTGLDILAKKIRDSGYSQWGESQTPLEDLNKVRRGE